MKTSEEEFEVLDGRSDTSLRVTLDTVLFILVYFLLSIFFLPFLRVLQLPIPHPLQTSHINTFLILIYSYICQLSGGCCHPLTKYKTTSLMFGVEFQCCVTGGGNWIDKQVEVTFSKVDNQKNVVTS